MPNVAAKVNLPGLVKRLVLLDNNFKIMIL